MTVPSPLDQIAAPLVEWYRQNKRDLPWRKDPTPYRVWVSEIMLQQTRVEAVKPYYARFLATLPTVKDLAEAEEEVLLKLWEGLGYYSRVRNMQKAAQEICQRFGGELPPSYEELLSLKGIGTYTAGAISAFAFGLPTAAVDGNVLRVVARLCADDRNILDAATKKDVEQALRQVVPHECPGDFGQGLIELGATVCLPGHGEVHCDKCPLRSVCLAHAQGLVEILPLRHKEQKRKTEQRTVFLLTCEEGIILSKRESRGLLAGLWEFPNTLEHLTEQQAKDFASAFASEVESVSPLPHAKHIFTHLTWEMTGYLVKVKSLHLPEHCRTVKKEDYPDYAIPSAFAAYKEILEKTIF